MKKTSLYGCERYYDLYGRTHRIGMFAEIDYHSNLASWYFKDLRHRINGYHICVLFKYNYLYGKNLGLNIGKLVL